jgi:hypothetical protein
VARANHRIRQRANRWFAHGHSPSNFPTSIALWGRNAYVDVNDGVLRVAVAAIGGTPDRLATAPINAVLGLAVDGHAAYFPEQGLGLQMVALDTRANSTLAPVSSAFGSVAVDATNAYFSADTLDIRSHQAGSSRSFGSAGSNRGLHPCRARHRAKPPYCHRTRRRGAWRTATKNPVVGSPVRRGDSPGRYGRLTWPHNAPWQTLDNMRTASAMYEPQA